MEFDEQEPVSNEAPTPALNSSQPGMPTPEQDYQAASNSMATYTQSTPPQKGSDKPWLKWLLIGIVLLIVAAAIYWFLLRSKPAPKSSTGQQSAQSTLQQPASASKINTTTKSYTSPNFNLAFSYPADWTVNDNGGGVMTVKSPSINLKSAAGTTVPGTIVLTIRDKTQKLTEFNSGNATATRNSVKIAYSKPTQTQRGDTYVSYLQYAATTTHGALDGIYITGDNGYQKDQAIPLVDIQKVDPVIDISFLNASGKPLSITDSAWNDTTLSGPLITMLESFAIN